MLKQCCYNCSFKRYNKDVLGRGETRTVIIVNIFGRDSVQNKRTIRIGDKRAEERKREWMIGIQNKAAEQSRKEKGIEIEHHELRGPTAIASITNRRYLCMNE